MPGPLQSRTRFRRSKRARRVSQLSPAIELLEQLQLLSASPLLDSIQASPQRTVNPSVTNLTPQGYTPAQVAGAYGFNQISFNNGAIKGNGAGQTIAIVDAYQDSNIASDLQTFDKQFGLAAPPNFTTAIETGAGTNAGWSLETALDVEWAHAMAPGANILLVEARSSSLSDLLSAVNYARSQPGVSVVSMSWGAGEFSSETAYDSYFSTPTGHTGITFVASSGDAGAGTSWPAVSPNVLAVGGTSLSIGPGNTYNGETAWSDSGGGQSVFEKEPTFQQSVQNSGARDTPDVAFDADPNTGFAVYDTVAYGRQTGWFEVGGTSAGAPQWSALIAIADQGRTLAGLGTLANGQSAIFNLPASDFHDITSGSNGFAAGAGFDLVTGRGSPAANLVAAGLVGTSAASQNSATQNVAGTQTTQNNGHNAANRIEQNPTATFFATAMQDSSSGDPSQSTANPAIAVLLGAASNRVVTPEQPAAVSTLVDFQAAHSLDGSAPAQVVGSWLAAMGVDTRNVGVVFPALSTAGLESGLSDSGDRLFAPTTSESVTAPASISAPGTEWFDDQQAVDDTDACFAQGAFLGSPASSSAEIETAGNRHNDSPSLAAAIGFVSLWGLRRHVRSKKRESNSDSNC